MKTRTGLQLSEGEGVLSVANGGTGQSNLDNVTVGNAEKATQDANGNVIDTTYATKTELGEAVNSKQDKTDNALSTTQKTVVGAINENKSAIDNLRENATKVSVGTTTTGEPGSQASVTNSGTDNNVVLDFAIPRGDSGLTPDQIQMFQYLAQHMTVDKETGKVIFTCEIEAPAFNAVTED